MVSRALPFPEDGTFSDSHVTMAAATKADLEGRIYEAPYIVNGAEFHRLIRVVRNKTGGDITAAKKFCQFGVAAAGDWSRKIAVFGTDCTADLPSSPLNDKYAAGFTIPEHDLFYVVESGPCLVLTGATSVSLANGVAVSSDGSGLVAAATTTAGKAIVGYADEAEDDEGAELLIHVRSLESQRSDPAS